MPRKKIKPPDDFDSVEEFLEYMRKAFARDVGAERDNRTAALEDDKFFVGDQWNPTVLQKREGAGLPCLTENYLVAFIGQSVGNRRMNETVIKVLPDNGSEKSKAVAEVREGLIAQIQKECRAHVAYDKAYQNALVGGVGNFQTRLVAAVNDVFAQDVLIEQLPNAQAVVWDCMSVDPTGSDARRVFVVSSLEQEEAEDLYPGAVFGDFAGDEGLRASLQSDGWFGDTVRVVSFWRMRKRKRTFAMIADGGVYDFTGVPRAEWEAQVLNDEDGVPLIREDVDSPYAELYIASGTELLEGPYTLPITQVPVFRVNGWEHNVGEVRHRWGVVRHLKDAQRGHNYWRSIVAEKLMYTPRAQWIARANAVSGREQEWRVSHQSYDPLLIFNDEAAEAPARAPPAQLEQALMLEGQTSVQAMRDISNIHEASLGQQSNEVSGKAINARLQVSELGTVIYNDNLKAAIEACGRVINELLYLTHKGPRVAKVLGPGNKEALVKLGKGAGLMDITAGKYTVTVTTGPSYTTKRIEAAESMQNMVNAMPNQMAIAADLIVEAQDWPGADKISKRLKTQLPAGVIPPEELTPEQQQQQQAAAEEAAKQAELAFAMAQAELAKKGAEVEDLQARAELAKAQAVRAVQEVEIKRESEKAKATSMRLNDSLKAIEVAEKRDDNAGEGD